MGLTSGSRLGAYEIQSPLGAGGMGEVYRATDTKLGRQVAVKILPAEMAHDPERLARFQREARAVAALNHPNVVTLYSVEESGGVHFLTMELIEGQPLDRLISAGGLPVERIVEIASALADALSAAHEKGIVHRDLKPANVMVTNDGRVKVLDFGLAKDVGAETSQDATLTSAGKTQVGVVLGTPAYMSPEQVSGRPLDHRSDIFSLGVLLHEMSTGTRPFEGNSSAELVSSILRDRPPSVTEVRPDLPSDLARVIRRCLEKDPRYRVQTARDVSNEFRDLGRMLSRSAAASSSVSRTDSVSELSATRAKEGFWISVLPFKYRGSEASLEKLADGLAEEITTGLSRFSHLRVIAHGSTSRYAAQASKADSGGKDLVARYVIEGSILQSGAKLRLAVQLVEAATGVHLWSETYERSFQTDEIFTLLDDFAPRIVSTVADWYGVLTYTICELVRTKPTGQLSPYEATLRAASYWYRLTAEEHAVARTCLERAVQQAPNYANGWAALSLLYTDEYCAGFNPQASSLDRAVQAARRATEAEPSNSLAYMALARALFYRKELKAFLAAAKTCIELNPMDSSALALLGSMMAYSDKWDDGCALVERALQLNARPPGWYWLPLSFRAYSRGDYGGALQMAVNINLPGYFATHEALAAIYGQLGESDLANRELQELLRLKPSFPTVAREHLLKTFRPELADLILDGLQKAGLRTGNSEETIDASRSPVSGVARTDEGFWVAVLPFKYAGSNSDLTALAEGLTDDVLTGFSKFSYLRVIARSSTARYAQQGVGVRTAAKDLGARYVMEGSIRQAGTKIRIAVQLIDAASGAGLWAETYDRAFSLETTLDLLDDVVPRIVATVGETQGILAHSMTEALRNRDPESLTPYEALLRSFGFHQHVNAAEHTAGITCLERAVKLAPDRADCWAMLSWLYRAEYTHGYNARPDSMDRSLAAARRAVAQAPSSQLAQAALASAFFFRREFGSFRAAAERALALNSMEGYITAFLGQHFAYAGEWEKGCALAERATQLNPNHPGWYSLPLALNAYRQHAGERALDYALKVNMPGLWTAQVAMAVVHTQLGMMEPARLAVRELLAMRPDFAAIAREELGKWFLPEMVEQMLTDLRKAGLQLSDVSVKAAVSSAIAPAQTASGESRADQGFWVAVLPFNYAGSNQDLKALADGLSEEVITGLSRFSYLRVIARGSTVKYSSESGDVRVIGKELGARYVMAGTLRQAGTTLRIAVQLVDAATGAHLWAQTYERTFRAEDVFAVQDDITDRVVATVADANGVLARSIAAGVEEKPEADLTALDWMLRCFTYRRNVTPEAHAKLREGLERFVEREPKHADVWACLALVYLDEFSFGFNVRADALGRALAAARRSVNIDRDCQNGNLMLAQVHFFRKDIAAFRATAEETIALNPRNTGALAQLAMLFVFIREFERGANLARHAMDLNPHHAGWYHVALVWDYFQKGEYQRALDEETRINIPGLFWQPLAVAACNGHLGREAEAAAAAEEMRRLDKDIEHHLWSRIHIYAYASGFMDRILEGLAKAGLRVVIPPAAPKEPEEAEKCNQDSETAATPSTQIPSSGGMASRTQSGEVRTAEGFWVAVLPFKYGGSNQDLKALADGLSEEVITGLSRFSYLRVIARGSTAKYSSESGDVRAIGKELGARYVIEGSLRQAGTKLRLSTQLSDTVSGAHLWAETYERAFTPESVFEVQDDLVPRIVSTVADQYGVLPRRMSESLRGKREDALTPHEAVLRAFSYFTRLTPEEHANIRRTLENAVREAPQHADCWAMLSLMYIVEYSDGFNALPNPLDRAQAAAQRAVDAAPTHALGYYALAFVYFFRKEKAPFRAAVERTVALNPMDGTLLGLLGLLMHHAGEEERGLQMVDAAMRLNPNYPGLLRFTAFSDAYCHGRYAEALEAAVRINMPGFFYAHASLAAALGQLGQREAARKAVADLLALRPDFASTARQEYAKWYDSERVEHLMDGLRKAGLEIPEAREQSPTQQ